MTKRKTMHFTFRIDTEIYDELQNEAKEQFITPTILMRIIVSKYLEHDKPLKAFNYIEIDKKFVEVWIQNFDDNIIENTAKLLGNHIIREYITYLYHAINTDSLLRFLELWLTTQGNISKKNKDGKYSYIINHGISKKYSIFLKGLLFCTIEEIINDKVNLIELSDNLLSFSFEVN